MSTEIVRDGYNTIAAAYHERRKNGPTEWYESLFGMLPPTGAVLDVGCGGGVPVAKLFADRGYQVTGCDISEEMVRIASQNVPAGQFAVADMRALPFEDEAFDVLVSLFAIIHVRREEHLDVLKGFARVLRPGGKLVLSMGVTDNPSEIKEGWYGGRMYWSHFDTATNEKLLGDAGFEILQIEETTTRSGERHLMVIAEKSRLSRVKEFYDRSYEREWNRLIDRSPAEYYTTMRVLGEYLQEGPKRILDVGAGPGRIAIELARQGHDVSMVDLSTGTIELARQKAREAKVELRSIEVRDARDLSGYDSGSYDVVLALGPMYHLLEQTDRDLANRELDRVLKPGGLAFVAFITRSALFRYRFTDEPAALHAWKERYTQFLQDGIIRQQPKVGFTDFFAVHPSDVSAIMRSADLEDVELIGAEGGMAFLHHKVRELQGEELESVMDFNFQFVRDPAMLYASEHLLYVGRKPFLKQ